MEALISQKFKVIYADPFKNSGRVIDGEEEKFDSMNVRRVCRLPVRHISDKDCVLFIWVKFSMLKAGLEVIEKWGFTYKTMAFNWMKRNEKNFNWALGPGAWTKSNSEICLLGIKGKPLRVDEGVSSVIDSRIEHGTKKPDIVRDCIVKLMGDVKRVELFADKKHEGWVCWGDGVGSEYKDYSPPAPEGLPSQTPVQDFRKSARIIKNRGENG